MQQHPVERVHPPDALMRLSNPVVGRLPPSPLGAGCRIRCSVATLIEEPAVVARVYDEKIGELGVQQAQRLLGIKVSV